MHSGAKPSQGPFKARQATEVNFAGAFTASGGPCGELSPCTLGVRFSQGSDLSGRAMLNRAMDMDRVVVEVHTSPFARDNRQIVNLLFTVTNQNISLTIFWGS